MPLNEQLPLLLGYGLLTDLFLLGLAAFAGIWGYELWRDWRRQRNKQAADFTVTISDADGIPLKQHRMTAKSTAELISHINGNWYR